MLPRNRYRMQDNTACMNVFLSELSLSYSNKNVLLVLDGAGWHRSKDLVIPGNIKFLFLPPYSPELNPVEKLWEYIKNNTTILYQHPNVT